MSPHKKRAPVVSLTIFFLILLSTGLSGYYVWQGFLHGFDKYLPILCSTLLLDGLGVFALVFKVSFETRRRAVVPFIASLSLLVVCSIHLAALANMRVGIISQDEQDSRRKTLDDDRHARNVKDARELVELNCAQCSPERKRRMYQSEMARLEKSSVVENFGPQISTGNEKSWGRRYVEDFATAVQLIFGLLAGLSMLINNFLRLYADESDEFPSSLDVEKRSSKTAPKMTTRNDTVSSKRDDTDERQKTTRVVSREGLKRLREALREIAFHHGPCHFKTDPKPDIGAIWIRQYRSSHGVAREIAGVKSKLDMLDDAVRMDRTAFRERLERFLRENGFEI